jgi:hypothetical protein
MHCETRILKTATVFSQVIDSCQPSLKGMIDINGIPMFICVDDYIDRTGVSKRWMMCCMNTFIQLIVTIGNIFCIEKTISISTGTKLPGWKQGC